MDPLRFGRTRVFISYAREDAATLEHLRREISDLERNSPGLVWADPDIRAGENWQDVIERVLDETRVAVLLISGSFKASDFIMTEELPRLEQGAREHGVRLLPLHVELTELPPRLAALNGVNDPEEPLQSQEGTDRNRILRKVVREIKKALEDVVVATVASDERQLAEPAIAALVEAGADVELRTWGEGERFDKNVLIDEMSWRRRFLACSGTRGAGPWAAEGLEKHWERSRKPAVVWGVLPPQDRFPAEARGLPFCRVKLRLDGDVLQETARATLLAGLGGEAVTSGDELPSPFVDPPPSLFSERLPVVDPEPPAVAAEEHLTPEIRDAIRQLLPQDLASKKLTVFLGPGASLGVEARPKRGGPSRPRLWDVSRKLLESLVEQDLLNGLLPPVDVAGSYYGLKNSNLESQVKQILVQRLAAPPPIHLLLAQLLARLKRLSSRRRRPSSGLAQRPSIDSWSGPVRLVVTTNFDLYMEEALLRSGLGFTRIVHHRVADRVEVNQYSRVRPLDEHRVDVSGPDGKSYEVSLNDADHLAEACRTIGSARYDAGDHSLADLRFQQLQPSDLLLYKFHGSADIEGSLALSLDQYFHFVKRCVTEDLVPKQLRTLIQDGDVLLFGYSLLDPDFRVLTQLLLEREDLANEDRRYALRLPPEARSRLDEAQAGDRGSHPDRQLEASLWSSIKVEALKRHGVQVLEERGDTFLEQLIAALPADPSQSDAEPSQPAA